MIIDGKEMEVVMNGKHYHCALDITMDFIGGKWKTIVLWYLMEGKKRFNELKKLIPGITDKMLSIQLKQLENDLLISRTVFAEVPPHVEYDLTEEGRSLVKILEELAAWGRYKGNKEGYMQVVEKMKDCK